MNVVFLPDGSIVRRDMQEARYNRLETTEPGVDNSESRPRSERYLNDRRLECERDVGRIRYSTSLLRLSGVSQVTTPDPRIHRRHDRLTHTLKVAGLAREIANDLVRSAAEESEQGRDTLDKILEFGGLDVSGCEAGGLGHDLGHAPFAHSSQDLLDNWLLDVGDTCGFEGNAQSLRIVSRLEPRKPDTLGFGLCAVSLGAMQKYPWFRDGKDPRRAKKFSVYREDSQCLDLAQKSLPKGMRDGRTTLEAAIVELADDITYAVHDLQDFMEAGVFDYQRFESEIPGIAGRLCSPGYSWPNLNDEPGAHSFDILVARSIRNSGLQIDPHGLGTALLSTKNMLSELSGLKDESWAHVAAIRRAFSQIISEIVGEISLSIPADSITSPVAPGKTGWHRLQAMKFVGRHYAIETHQVALQERSNQAALRSLLESLLAWTLSVGVHSLPPPLNEYVGGLMIKGQLNDGPSLRRVIVDFVCGLSDHDCCELSAQLGGREMPLV